MNIFDGMSERKILEAIENGVLQDLLGQGKPFQWEDYAHTARDQQLVYDMLRKNGFTLPWIEEAQEIGQLTAQIRKDLETVHREEGFSPSSKAYNRIQKRLQVLNKRIMDYNISVPLQRFQIALLSLKLEVERTKSDKPDPLQDF